MKTPVIFSARSHNNGCDDARFLLLAKKKVLNFQGLLRWCHRESNQGHTDFQSVALPTELWHPIFDPTKIDIF